MSTWHSPHSHFPLELPFANPFSFQRTFAWTAGAKTTQELFLVLSLAAEDIKALLGESPFSGEASGTLQSGSLSSPCRRINPCMVFVSTTTSSPSTTTSTFSDTVKRSNN